MSKKTRNILIIVVLLIALIGGGGYYLSQNAGVAVDTGTVSTSELAVTVLASGKVAAGVSHEIYPSTQGLVSKVYVQDGDEVAKGDKLIKLTDDALQIQLKQAQSGLAQAKSALSQANSASSTKNAGIAAAQAGVDAAKTALASAKRVRDISKSSYVSAKAVLKATDPTSPTYSTIKASVTQAEIAYEQAKSGVAQATAGLKQAQSGLTQAKAADVAGAKASASAAVSAAQKAYDIAKKAVDDALITAPADGTVLVSASPASMQAAAAGGSAGGSELAKGSAVTPGAPVMTIFDPKKMSFEAEVDEVDISKVEVGQKAQVTLDSYAGGTLEAVVTSIGSTAQTTLTGGTVFPVELEIIAGDYSPKIGMKGDVTIEISVEQSALTIPIEALFSEGSTDFVYQIQDGKLKKTEIVAGTTTDTVVEILSGIEKDVTVALAGKSPLMEGMMVKASESK